MTAAKLRAYGAAIPALRVQLVELVGKLLAVRNLGGTAKEKLDELRGEWPILQPSVEAFSADSEPAEWTVFDDLKECLPAAQSDKVKDLVYAIRGNKNQKQPGIIAQLLDAYGAYRAAPATLEISALAADVAAELERRKRDERVVTFDDLLILARRLLQDHPEVALSATGARSALCWSTNTRTPTRSRTASCAF